LRSLSWSGAGAGNKLAKMASKVSVSVLSIL
jgi:hypothetical protein